MSIDQTVPPIPPTASVPPADAALGPRIRWAGIVWGALFAAFAAGALIVIGSADARDDIHDRLLGFDPSTVNPGWVVGVVAVAIGVVLLIVGGLALLRHAQRRDPAS